MLDQIFLETPIGRAGLRHPLKIPYNGGTTKEIGVAGSKHQNFVHWNEKTAVLRQVEIRERGPHHSADREGHDW